MREVLYMAHPVAPTAEEIAATPSHTGWSEAEAGPNLEGGGRPISEASRARTALGANIDRALRWLAWLRGSFPETTFIAPWIASILAGADDADPAQREAGMVDDCATIERCDGIVLVGGRIPSGMRREMERGKAYYDALERYGCGCRSTTFDVHDLTALGADAPTQPAWFERTAAARTFQIWIEQGCKIWELANKR